MPLKLYTHAEGDSAIAKMSAGILTASEHAVLSTNGWGPFSASAHDWVRHYFEDPANAAKLSLLGFLLTVLDRRPLHVLSLGAGPCVLEHLLSRLMPHQGSVTATDFDPYFVEKASELFPELTCRVFDMTTDEVERLVTDRPPEIAVFFGSAYVLDDAQFVRLCRSLRRAGVREIVDFHGGHLSTGKMLIERASRTKHAVYEQLRIQRPRPQGKYHGLARTGGELRRLYRAAGVGVLRQASVGSYDHIIHGRLP